jgi:glyoxylase-like metal-dependent hydrolase (beta-lactamase superfamily II)
MFQELEYLAGQVWLYPMHPQPEVVQPNVGIIRAGTRTILVDAGNSPRHARRIMGELAASGFPSVKTLIYTHHHWDHVFGGMAYNADTIIAHEACILPLQQAASRVWNNTALREEAQRVPHLHTRNTAISSAVEDWRDFRIVLPRITFTKSLTLHLDGNAAIELVHVGGRHAAESIIVKIPDAKVMFLGDCYYPPPAAERSVDDDALDVAMLEAFVAENYAIYVDGHGKPRTLENMQALIAYERQQHPTE